MTLPPSWRSSSARAAAKRPRRRHRPWRFSRGSDGNGTPQARGERSLSMHSRHDRWIAVAMIAPSVVLLAIFVYGFIGQTVYVSLTDWGAGAALAAAPKLLLVGLDNYKGLFTGFLDVRFRQDMVNMVVLTLLFVGGCLGVGLLLATLVDQRIRGEGFFRTLFLF